MVALVLLLRLPSISLHRFSSRPSASACSSRMRPRNNSVIGCWLMTKLAPSTAIYSAWSFYDDECMSLQATRVYRGMPTGEYNSVKS